MQSADGPANHERQSGIRFGPEADSATITAPCSTPRGHWLGWESRTGRATKASVRFELWNHRLDAQLAKTEG
jgi:hypothetical protein